MLILNDIHIGFRRSGGTTPSSRETLRDYLLSGLQDLLNQSTESNLVIVGDLFDDFEVDTRDFMAAYGLLMGWLVHGKSLTLIAGNHDHSPRGSKVSHFNALCDILGNTFPDNVVIVPVGGARFVAPGVYAIAHCANQDLFDAALADVPDSTKYLLLHANFDNNFAVMSDHSLNVSEAQARDLTDRKIRLVFAHEHQPRICLGGWVQVLGNQFPTSVADCLGNHSKFAYVLDGFHGEGLHGVETWNADGSFVEVDWRDLAGTEGQFIRVTGVAKATESSDVVNAISSFRQRSQAFVVTNVVQTEGLIDVKDLPAQFEAAKTFDVMTFIESHLDEREVGVVKALLEKA